MADQRAGVIVDEISRIVPESDGTRPKRTNGQYLTDQHDYVAPY